MSDAFAEPLAQFIASIDPPSPEDAATARGYGSIEPVLGEMVFSFMLWETTAKHADASMHKLSEAFIDLNELRIALPDELASIVGSRCPRGPERTLRLRMALNEIFLLEHEMSLARLRELPKREARQYLIDLPGMPSFVASRVCLLALGAHVFPLDAVLRQVLVSKKAADASLTIDQCAAWLERQFRAGEAIDAYLRLEAFAASSSKKSPAIPAAKSTSTSRSKPRSTSSTKKSSPKSSTKPSTKSPSKPAASKPQRSGPKASS